MVGSFEDSMNDFKVLGLKLAGRGFVNEETNEEHFKGFYGASAKSCKDIFKDLKELLEEEDHGVTINPKYFLLSL